ncbi:LemA family protein [Aquihabitans sp. McL0605]|uniref:LemA family protein n=1 Tax=Aquihabitans sp. McL0605 TaxID=3415671 RepID=UPI003CF2C892
MAVLVVLIVLVIVVGLIFVVLYNGLVALKNKVEAAWAQIDVQLTRRSELIPNLVETVKGYAAHEKDTLDAVIRARNAAQSASGPQEAAAADNMLTGALKSVFALSEAYPDLKANTNFLALQEELTATEDKIAYARQFYNDTVNKYNTKIQTLPSNVIAGMLNYAPREYFEAAGEARGPVSVQF